MYDENTDGGDDPYETAGPSHQLVAGPQYTVDKSALRKRMASVEYESLNDSNAAASSLLPCLSQYRERWVMGAVLLTLIVSIMAIAGVFSGSGGCGGGPDCDLLELVNEICSCEINDRPSCHWAHPDPKRPCLVEGSTVRIFDAPISLAMALKFSHAIKFADVTELYLVNTGLGDAGTKLIAVAVTGHQTLVKLVFRSDGVSSEGACAVAKMLLDNRSIEFLLMERNQIGDEGAMCFRKALLTNNKLTFLSLWKNSVGSQGAIELSSALSTNLILKDLILTHNLITVGGAGADALQKATADRSLAGAPIDIKWKETNF